jgi:hypothetical protein
VNKAKLLWRVGLGLLLLMLPLGAALGQTEKRYVTTTIRGVLANPKSGEPMTGAVVRFTPTMPGEPEVEAVTAANGQFVAEGLGYGTYVVVIRTAEGETIRGINELPITAGELIEVEFTLSDRVRSSTSLFNQPERFLAVVDKEKHSMKRFWKQFGAFFALVIGSGIAFF